MAAKVSTTDWRVQLLDDLKAPRSATNLAALQAWALSESGYDSTFGTWLAGPNAYNPLAITDSYGIPTVGSVNSVGVKKFGSTAAGAQATALFLQHGYGGVIQALRDSDPVALFSAVNNSGWCRGCQGGIYPTGLHSMISGGQVQGGTASFRGSSGGKVQLMLAGKLRTATKTSSNDGTPVDSGGLFGTCKITTTSVPLASGGIPSGGFGCYVEKSLIFGGLAAGGALLMLVGIGLIVSPGFVSGKFGVAGELAAALGSQARSAAPADAQTTPAESQPAPSSLAEQREKRLQATHNADLRRKRALARKAEADAREAEARNPSGRQRIRKAGQGSPIYEVPGYEASVMKG